MALRTQIIVLRVVLRLFDPSEDLLLCLGVDPHAQLSFATHAGFLCDEPVDIFSFPSGVGADIDGVNFLICKEPFHDPKLLFDTVDHLVAVLIRDKRNSGKRPLLVFRIICVRITHCDQMPDAPGHNSIFRFHISIS